MLGITALTGDNAGAYWSDLSAEDYYVSGGEPPGRWAGRGVGALGLAGMVSRDDLKALLAGLDLASDKPLVQGAGKPGQHRPGWDMCFSVPKSISVVWSQAPEGLRHAIQEAQNRAVAAGINHLESIAITRRGHGGKKKEAAGLVVAKFEHGCSRAQDPQLHTHCLMCNVSLRDDGTFGTLEPFEIYRQKMATGAIYRTELASQIQLLGFSVERDGDSFKITGVPDELCAQFSQRSQEIEDFLRDVGHNGAKAAQVAARATRQSKEARPRSELFAEWQARAAEQGFTLDQVPRFQEASDDSMPEPDVILRQITEQRSTFEARDILRAVAVEAQGRVNAAAIPAEAARALESPGLVRLRGADGEIRYSTREMVELEATLAEAATTRKGEDRHPVSTAVLAAAKAARTLSDEQAAALDNITGQDGVSLIQGGAGTGKSYLLGAAREVWEASGYSVVGAALAGKAASGLEEGAGIKSSTLHSLLKELGEGKISLTDKTIVVVDEAGMVGSRQLSRLLSEANGVGSKIVLVGDSRQLQPVDAGGAFRALQTRLGAAELGEIRRQKAEWHKDAAQDAAAGDVCSALRAYVDRGALHVAPNRTAAIAAMARDWSQSCGQDPRQGVMLANTRAEANLSNTLARAHQAEAGRLGAKVEFPRAAAGQPAPAPLEVCEGERIIFLKNNHKLGVKNGTLGTVQYVSSRVDNSSLRVMLDDGRCITINSERYSSIDYAYAITTHKAQGLTIPQSFVLAGGAMASAEMSYVQMTRHTTGCQIYLSQTDPEHDMMKEIEAQGKSMSKARQKDTTLDYVVDTTEQIDNANTHEKRIIMTEEMEM